MIKRILQHTFSLLNIDHVQLTSKWSYRNVISPYYRIYLIDEGFGEVSDQSGTILLEPGYLYMIPSFTLCNLVCTDHLSQFFVQFFEESADGVSLFTHNRTILKIKATPLDIHLFNHLLQINPYRGINRSDDPKVYEKTFSIRNTRNLTISKIPLITWRRRVYCCSLSAAFYSFSCAGAAKQKLRRSK